MPRHLVEVMRGIGTIYAGDVPLRTTAYELSMWSDDDLPRAEGDVVGVFARVDGHIEIAGIAEAVVLAGPGTLTLTLEDGRRLAFELTGTGGGIVGHGWVA